MNKIPNFIVAGAAKCGTTSLYHYLLQHPDVFMSPVKETNYFARDIKPEEFSREYKGYELSKNFNIEAYVNGPMTSRQWGTYVRKREHYLKLFSKAGKAIALGEVSNSYMYSSEAAENIRQDFPLMKIVMILRQPAERAYSHYLANLRDGRTILSFKDEINHDDRKAEHGWGISHLYYELGCYDDQVKRFQTLFPASQIRIYLFDDLKKNPADVVSDLFRFIGVNPDIVINFREKHNEARIPKNPGLIKWLTQTGLKRKLFRVLPDAMKRSVKDSFFRDGKVPAMSPEDKAWMTDRYKTNIIALQDTLGRNLEHWLK